MAASKVPLSRERIFAVALALIDRRGVAALSLRELAQELGVYPTAVYWYVEDRDALIAGTVALALGKVGARVPKGAWQDRLRALLVRFRAAVRRHPNLAPVIGTELISNSPLDLPMLDHIVFALEEAGFEGRGLVDAFNVFVAALCGFATLEVARPPAENAQAWAHAQRERVRQIPAREHPALARHLEQLQDRAFILRWTSGQQRPLTTGFEAWIDVVIGGLEARAAHGATSQGA